MPSIETSDPVEFPAVYMRDRVPSACTLVLEVEREQGDTWAVILPADVADGPHLCLDIASMRRLVSAWSQIDL